MSKLRAAAPEFVPEAQIAAFAELEEFRDDMCESFFADFSSCAVCKGYIYRPTTDVAKQLGVCGCAAAFEMELADAESAAAAASPYQQPSKEAQHALLTVDYDKRRHRALAVPDFEPSTPPSRAAPPPWRKAQARKGAAGRTKPRAPRLRPRAILK